MYAARVLSDIHQRRPAGASGASARGAAGGRYTGQRGVPRGAGLGDEPHLRRQTGGYLGNTGRYTGQRGVPRGAGLGDEPHLRRQTGGYLGNTGRYTGQRGVPRGAGLGDEPHLRRQTGGYLGHWPIYGAAGCTTWSGARR